MDEALDMATDAYTAPGAPGSGCSKACIREQLEDYYKGKNCSPVITHTRSGEAAPARPAGGSGQIGGVS